MSSVKLSRLNNSIPDIYDLFICSSSFEDRCLSAPSRLKRKHFEKVVVIENKRGSELIHKNTEKICGLYSGKVRVLSIDYQDPIEIADTICSEIKRTSQRRKANVLVDITTFTHETLMILLKVIAIKKSQITATCLYTNASDYCPNSDLDRKWLSRGCKEIHSILGYSGLLLPSQRTRLIVVVGYEYNRAADVISAFEPNSLTLVYGTSDNSTTEKNKEANKLYLDLVQQMSFNFEFIERVEIPCDDPDKTAEILCELYKTHSDENIIVIPMNNKLSTIGVAKSIMLNDSVQACYAPAVIYNESDYSLPGKSCYIYKF